MRVDVEEVSVHFVTERKISTLHEIYFQDPTPTDCISFPIDESLKMQYRLLGDVFICPRAAREYTEKEGGEIYEEVTRYLIHALLHLLGYVDIGKKRQAMLRKQESLLLHLKNKGLLLRAKTS